MYDKEVFSRIHRSERIIYVADNLAVEPWHNGAGVE